MEKEKDKICVLHTDSVPSSANIILFQDLTLKKCQDAELVHKSRTSVYKDIVLPSIPDNYSGYHSKCYSKYTAVSASKKKAVVQQKGSSDTPSTETSAAEPLQEVNHNIGRQSLRSKPKDTETNKSSHIFPTVCLFCEKKDKKISGKREVLHQIETIEFQETVLKEAQIKEDHKLIRKILGVDLIAKEGRYHNSCRKAYSYQATVISRRLSAEQSNNATSNSQRKSAIRKKAFESTTSYIEVHVFNNEEVHRFHTIAEHYTMLLAEFGFDSDDLAYVRKDLFLDKLQRHYGERLKVIRHPTKGVGKILFKSSLSTDKAIVTTFDLKVNLSVKVKEVAFLLRNEILRSPVNKLPEAISTKDVIAGEITVPALLNTFFENLVTTGGDRNKKQPISDNKKRRIESLAHDAIYAVSNGRIMPSKQLLLALSMKALTGSRKVIEVLNRYGHCVSYSVAEEIETELIFSAMEKSRLLPDGLHQLPFHHTGVGFDNFDLFVDTLSGKETLHDTVGIVYQDVPASTIPESLSCSIVTSRPSVQLQPTKKRRRALEVEDFPIIPYHRSLKLNTQSLTDLEDETRAVIAPLYSIAQKFDFI